MTCFPGTLLIVDDESSVCRALSRILSKKIKEIVSVHNIADALLVLETKIITHVLCDHLLGPGQPLGLDVASRWKENFPSIQKVIILTGTQATLENETEGIDLIIPKTTDPLELADILGL